MSDKTQHVEQTVREALESGQDIYQKVRTITLKALTEHELDQENIKEVVQAVGRGISSGVNSQNQMAQQVFKQSFEALDDALVSTAEATKLALEEAASKVNEFSEHDMKKTAEDLKSLEDLFLETMGDVARESSDVVSDIVRDFISHAQNSGTAVGKQTQTVLDALGHLTQSGGNVVMTTTVETTSKLARIGSGILAGIAESLQSDNAKK